MKVYNYTVIFEPVEEGGYDVIIEKSETSLAWICSGSQPA